jgi:hypothetical protein
MAGLKTLAKELQSKGRNGDTMLAHINPQEAGILKALGGSGTRNPDTGLPEFFYKRYISPAIASINPFNPGSGLNKTINTTPVIGDINKAANKLGTQIFQPLEKAIVQPTSRGLADFDKQVAKTIPGGWSTVGQVALSAMGAPVPLQVAYGAARGGGLMRTGSSLEKTNLQGAVIGGATAYAQAKLGEYMRGAVPPGTESTTDMATLPVSQTAPITDYSTSLTTSPPPEVFAPGPPPLPPNIDAGYFDVPPTAISSTPPPPVGDFAGSFSDPTAGMAYSPPNVSGYDVGGAGVPSPASPSFLDRMATKSGDAVSDTVKFVTEPTKAISTAGKTLSGLESLTTGPATLKATTAATGIDPMQIAGMALYGETSLAGMEEQRKYLEEAKRANAISQAEYDKAMASINSQRDYAADVVSRNQFNPNPNRDVSIGETFYRRGDENESLYGRAPTSGSTLYAMGGSVDDELGGDYSAMGMDQGNLQKGLFGLGYAAGGMPNLALSRLSQPAFNEGAVGGIQQFAAGGQPRFLSGGGDGMSDSIKASINGAQEARLADGEFVIPADVVSHLGNGSSKAGAKQLYSMMDKIRKARTGRKSQGKQINPRKYLPA